MHADDFRKVSFRELSKLLRLVPRGLNLPAGSDTPQNNVLRGIRPRGTKSCGVSNPAEQLFFYKYEYFWKFETEFNWGLYGVDSWKKPEVKNLVLLSL
jgi:hypothetical protein